MTTITEKQADMKSVWAISSILEGVTQCHDEWAIFAPRCEPFWPSLSSIEGVMRVQTAARGITLACESQKPAVVFVPNRQLTRAIELSSTLTLSMPLVLVLEDHPILAPQLCPRESAARAGLCVIEPSDPSEVSACATAAVKMSTASRAPCVLITHHWLLGASASVECVAEQVQQAPRPTLEIDSPLRLGRRLELNRQRTLPSPGEKVSVGFVTVGLSDPALKYLVSELQLLGRVPMLNLRLLNPIDTIPIERMLSRCRNVVVLEPRPGEVEREIISVGQTMRRDGRDVAVIWGTKLPPIDPDQQSVPVPVDSLHPSVVARLTQHLLHDVRPTALVSEQLIPEGKSLNVPSPLRASFGTKAALDLLRETAIRVLSGESELGDVVIDGLHIGDSEGERVYVETWGEKRFMQDGISVVRDAISQNESRILLVWRSSEVGHAISTMVESINPAKSDDYKNVQEVSLENGEDLEIALATASKHKSVSVIIVSDGDEPRFDIEKLALTAAEIDRRGFRPQQAIVIPIEQMAMVRFGTFEAFQPSMSAPAMPLETAITTKWLKPQYRRWRLSLRPVLERAQVTRTKPPVRVVEESSVRLSPPKPIHAAAAKWRVHIAGTRGDQPGVVGDVLMEAGRQMGYQVHAQCDSAFVGAGRRAWSQVMFTRRQTQKSYRPHIGAIPWGEADVLLGWDREEVIRAIDPKGELRVGSTERTYAIINIDPLESQTSMTDFDGNPATLDLDTMKSACIAEFAQLHGFASLARYRFHNERLGDLLQLGMAFQLGFIPVTVDAINSAVAKVEQDGFARSVEAFEFGRRVALNPDGAWQPVKEESEIDLQRLIKRCIRDFDKKGTRGVAQADVIGRLIQRSRQALPELADTKEGRQATIDLVIAIRRCVLWGGEEAANRFVSLLYKLYASDTSQNERALTVNAVLPLAEAILIRDPIYLARLAQSPEVIRRVRKRLNVRKSRGDSLQRRFLTRIRLRLWNWSLQVDLRTSDWSSVLVASLGKVLPSHWRGRAKDRAVREAIVHAVNQAATSTGQSDDWVRRFAQLHKLACEGTFHSLTVDEIKRILQS
jgi:hypothetical protein